MLPRFELRHAAPGAHGLRGGGDGGSSQSSSTTSTSDRRVVAAPGSSTVSGDSSSAVTNISITSTDSAVTQSAFDLANNSTQAAYTSMEDALGFANSNDTRYFEAMKAMSKQVIDATSTAAGNAQAAVAQAYQSAADTTSGARQMVMIGFVVVCIVAAAALGKRA